MATERDDDQQMEAYLAQLNGKAWGMSLGVLFGLGLFAATAILVLRGGENVGDMMGRLSHFFPGYDVNWQGAFLGLGYGFGVGYVTGRIICTVYNRTSKE